MNSYISANEKAQLIRVILMGNVLKDAIDVYAGLDSTDKAFLTELRHGRTRIEKAVKLRRLSLDNDADDKLLAGAAKLHPLFVPTPEARKIHKDLLELQSVLPMDIEDLQDWYGFVIEYTCKNCIRVDYKECQARRVLTKYEICPISPEAKDACQYSYVAEVVAEEAEAPGMVEKPEFAELGSVSFREHYAAKKQIEELQAKNTEYIEQIQGLHSQVAEHDRLISELESLKIESVSYEKNLNCIVDLKEELQAKCDQLTAENSRLTRGYYAIQDLIRTIHKKETPQQLPFAPSQTNSTKQGRYRVECYCGEEYFADMYNGFPEGRTKAYCRNCSQRVFTDRQADKVIDPADGAKAILLTNRYFVNNKPREPQQVAQEQTPASTPVIPSKTRELKKAPDLRSIKNVGRDYKDPCQLLG